MYTVKTRNMAVEVAKVLCDGYRSNNSKVTGYKKDLPEPTPFLNCDLVPRQYKILWCETFGVAHILEHAMKRLLLLTLLFSFPPWQHPSTAYRSKPVRRMAEYQTVHHLLCSRSAQKSRADEAASNNRRGRELDLLYP